MDPVLPWLRIVILIIIYACFALLASKIIQKTNANIKEMKSRTSSFILIIGAITNLIVLTITILFILFIDGRSIKSLGIVFADKDLIFSIISFLSTFIVAIIFIYLSERKGVLEKVNVKIPVKGFGQVLSLFSTIAILFLIATQEEVLFRGYISLNLFYLGPVIVIITSTIFFTIIHFITNKVTLYQVISWILVGGVLTFFYLVSGSIFIVIILHFIIDLINVLIFNIVGKFSFFEISPPFTDKHRLIFRIVFCIILLIIFIKYYGISIRLTL